MNDAEPYLRTVVSTFIRDIAPALSTPAAQARADLVETILIRLIAHLRLDATGKANYWQDIGAELGRMPPEMSEPSSDNSQTVAALLSDIQSRTQDGTLRSDASEHLDRHLATAFQSLGGREADRLVGLVAAAEKKFRDRIEDAVSSETRSLKSPDTRETPPAITPENLTNYLRRKFPTLPDVVATSVEILSGGRSKIIYSATLEGAGSWPSEIVLKQDNAVDLSGSPAPYEFPVLDQLWKRGFPVPQPLWAEDGTSELGQPFLAMSRVRGTSGGTLFQMKAPAAAARDLAKFFARLHTVDIVETGLAGKLTWGTSAFPAKDMIDLYYEKWRKIGLCPMPLMEATFAWLRSHLTPEFVSHTLVHGDSSFHNMMVHDGRLGVMIDWEFAHAGDPAEDIMGCQESVRQVMPWEEFLEIYRHNGGADISEDRRRFFSLWRSVRFAVASAGAAKVIESGTRMDAGFAWIGTHIFERLLQNIARELSVACSET